MMTIDFPVFRQLHIQVLKQGSALLHRNVIRCVQMINIDISKKKTWAGPCSSSKLSAVKSTHIATDCTIETRSARQKSLSGMMCQHI